MPAMDVYQPCGWSATSCSEWFSLVSPCVACRMRRSNFIGCHVLEAKTYSNSWQNLAMMLANIRCQSEGGLDNAAGPSVLPCLSSPVQLEDEVSDMGFLNTASLGCIGIQDHQLDLLYNCKSLRHCTQAWQKG